jgi:HSP20 family molecular chaperone IbpA
MTAEHCSCLNVHTQPCARTPPTAATSRAYCSLDLAGVRKDNININVNEDNTLTIEARRPRHEKDKGKGATEETTGSGGGGGQGAKEEGGATGREVQQWMCRECPHGRLSRVVALPSDADVDKADVHFEVSKA